MSLQIEYTKPTEVRAEDIKPGELCTFSDEILMRMGGGYAPHIESDSEYLVMAAIDNGSLRRIHRRCGVVRVKARLIVEQA